MSTLKFKMEISIFKLGLTLLIIVGHVSTRDLPSAGLLDEMPTNCTGVGFCLERHENYPQKKIDELLTEKFQISLASFHEEPVARVGSPPDNQNDCEKKVTNGEIYEILDEHDNVRVVVQSPKIFKQQIRIEQCVGTGRLMKNGGTHHFTSEELEDNYITCIETKMDYNFLVLTRDGEGVESVKSKFGIPVCCMCRYEDIDQEYD